MAPTTAAKHVCNHCVVAYNIETFMDVAEFKRTMDEWLVMLKTTKPAPGYDRVLYPACRKPNVRRNISPRVSLCIMKSWNGCVKPALNCTPPATSE